MHNLYLYTGSYKNKKMVVVRQRDNLMTPIDDMNEETDLAKIKLLDDSNSTRAMLARGKLVKSISVPTFAAKTINGP